MKKKFFEGEFDDATRLKLEIFRRYIREWLSVIMTRPKDRRKQIKRVVIYDFFAGRGRDNAGNPGSPLIIVKEMRNYCESNAEVKADIAPTMLFNDIEPQHIAELKEFVKEIACEQPCCRIEYTSLPFEQAFTRHLPDMMDPSAANLVIMDQFGVKEVTPGVVQKLLCCSKTDVLFFLSTSFIKRFIETPEIGGKYDLSVDEVKDREYNAIHRYICDYYREKLGSGSSYLAPFSIQKGSNIYGVIFGTSHLYGLEKFLNICWSLDTVTGEANYNIDGDLSWHGQTLFAECNRIRKVDLFRNDLREYIAQNNPDNIALNVFCLTKGFSPAKAGEELKTMQKQRELSVWNIPENKPARKGAFYLGWDNCKTNAARARFSVETKS